MAVVPGGAGVHGPLAGDLVPRSSSSRAEEGAAHLYEKRKKKVSQNGSLVKRGHLATGEETLGKSSLKLGEEEENDDDYDDIVTASPSPSPRGERRGKSKFRKLLFMRISRGNRDMCVHTLHLVNQRRPEN